MNDEFSEALDRLLADASSPQAVRQIEQGAPVDPVWNAIEGSGFLDALLPESQGGAGFGLRDAFALMVAEGRHATPAPLAHTMLARAVLASQDVTPPQGPIAIASSAQQSPDGQIACRNTPYGMVAQWVIAPATQGWLLLPVASAARAHTGIHGSLRADLTWTSASQAAHASTADFPWQEAGAVIAAAQLVGAMDRTLEMTVKFANERVQFGRPIGKFQAIQHQLAVMAEQAAAARMAAQIGCDASGFTPDRLRAAAAKARASEAAALVAPMAHAIHGAIGITAELDLQLYTRRLHEWRADFGSERAWNRVLGQALLADARPALDFMRGELLPS